METHMVLDNSVCSDAASLELETWLSASLNMLCSASKAGRLSLNRFLFGGGLFEALPFPVPPSVELLDLASTVCLSLLNITSK